MTTSVTLYFFYKAEEISAAPYISTDTLYIFSSCFRKNTWQFQSKQDTKLDKEGEYFLEGVCYNSSMYRYTLDVRNCQDEP